VNFELRGIIVNVGLKKIHPTRGLIVAEVAVMGITRVVG